jgi:hypothetical protein
MNGNSNQSTGFSVGVSQIGYGLAILLFCLMPFTEISCVKNGVVTETRKQSGLQAALGGSTTIDKTGMSSGSLRGPRGRPLMLAYGIFLCAGLAILIFAPLRRDWFVAEAICCVLAVTCITAQYVLLPDYRNRLGLHRGGDFGDTIGHYTIWLYGSIANSVMLTVFAFMRVRAREVVTQDYMPSEANESKNLDR